MTKEYPDDLQDVPRPAGVDKRTFQEVENLLIDTNTGDIYYFHPFYYYNKSTDPDTTILNEVIRVTYI